MSPKTGLQMWMKKSVKLALAENPSGKFWGCQLWKAVHPSKIWWIDPINVSNQS